MSGKRRVQCEDCDHKWWLITENVAADCPECRCPYYQDVGAPGKVDVVPPSPQAATKMETKGKNTLRRCEDCDHVYHSEGQFGDCPKCRCPYYQEIGTGTKKANVNGTQAAPSAKAKAAPPETNGVLRRCEDCEHVYRSGGQARDCPECRCPYFEELQASQDGPTSGAGATLLHARTIVDDESDSSSSSSEEEELLIGAAGSRNADRGITSAPPPVDRAALLQSILEDEDEDGVGGAQSESLSRSSVRKIKEMEGSTKIELTLSMCLEESMNGDLAEEATADDRKIRDMILRIRDLTPNEELELEMLLTKYGVDKYF